MHGRANHATVQRINAGLKARGLVTWLDHDRMEGDIPAMMADGVGGSAVVVCFITKNYCAKVCLSFTTHTYAHTLYTTLTTRTYTHTHILSLTTNTHTHYLSVFPFLSLSCLINTTIPE